MSYPHPTRPCFAAQSSDDRVTIVVEDKWYRTLGRSLWNVLYRSNRAYKFIASVGILTQHKRTVQRDFTHWWIMWNDLHPSEFPLPPVLSRFPKLSKNEPSFPEYAYNKSDLIDEHGRETRRGASLRRAWDKIPEDDRDLLLFCWAAQRKAVENVYEFCRPGRIVLPQDMRRLHVESKDTAVRVVTDALTNGPEPYDYERLRKRAVEVINTSKLFL